MNRTILILIAIFLGEVLLLLLAGWIYNLLSNSGVFGKDLRVRRVSAVLFIFLPVLCGLALFPWFIYMNGQSAGGAQVSLPGVSSGPPGKIVYTCQVFGDMERDQVCLIYPDGSGQTRLTQDDSGDYHYPSLAPGGLSMVFSGRTSAGYELFEQVLGGELRQLTEGMADATAPAISPDGRSIVFARRTESGQSVWIMDRDSGEARQVFGPPDGNGWDPVWSPDGSQVLFASDREGGIHLFRMDADGQNLQRVSSIAGIRGRSDWSAAEPVIAAYAGETWNREIYLMGLDGGNVRQITSGGNNLAPSFSPDGRWITFTSYRDHYREDNGCEIYIMRTDGSQVTRLTDNNTCDWQPRWGD